MTLSARIKLLEKLAIDNSPSLLTAVGVVGTIATAVLTHRAATKTERELDRALINGVYPDARKEVVKLVWKNYVPPVLVGALTVTSIVGANRIGSKRAAAIAAAYTLSERSFAEYREKVIEKVGDSKARAIADEHAQDRVRQNPLSESNTFVVGSGDVRCCDLMTMRYFDSSIEALKKAQNDTNYQILHDGYASLTDFYDRIGLPRTDISEQIGWNQDKLLELEFSTVLSEDGRPCVAYRFQQQPFPRYHHLHP